MDTEDNSACVRGDLWELWSVYKCLVLSLVYREYSLSYLSISSFPLSSPRFHSLPRTGGLLKKVCKVYGVFRSIWQCRWDRGNTASDLAVSLFCFRHLASSSGLAALLAKPESNHLNLLCALRGHPVTVSLNMCSTIHIHPHNAGEYKITSTKVSVVL